MHAVKTQKCVYSTLFAKEKKKTRKYDPKLKDTNRKLRTSKYLIKITEPDAQQQYHT